MQDQKHGEGLPTWPEITWIPPFSIALRSLSDSRVAQDMQYHLHNHRIVLGQRTSSWASDISVCHGLPFVRK